jgi:hypothetical protein
VPDSEHAVPPRFNKTIVTQVTSPATSHDLTVAAT